MNATAWSVAAGRRAGAFTLALLCGVAVPLSPLGAEYFVTGEIVRSSWSAVGVTYVAGVGLVSRSQSVLVIMLLAASMLAFLYGVDMKEAYHHLHDAASRLVPVGAGAGDTVVKWVIGWASLVYGIEWVLRHLIEGKSFLET